jgi:hypothetical protein
MKKKLPTMLVSIMDSASRVLYSAFLSRDSSLITS